MLRMLLCIRLLFKGESSRTTFLRGVKSKMAKSENELLEAFNKDPSEYHSENAFIYNARTEFMRYGVSSPDSTWRFTDINAMYEFCGTYPALLVVPKKVKDLTLQFTSSFRSRARIPVLTYIYKPNMASISRSSQPLVGITNRRCEQDEHLVHSIFASNRKEGRFPDNQIVSIPESPKTVALNYFKNGVVLDARPMLNIKAQKTVGGGTESKSVYKNIKTDVLNIENIHSLQTSFSLLLDEVAHNDFERLPIGRNDESKWLHKLKLILDGTIKIVKTISEYNLNVIIHCSDGWDRTPQLSSLAQICLDPYFRTIEGLATLIEKDWISFGHQFGDRCGHLTDTGARICGSLTQTQYRQKETGRNDKDNMLDPYYSTVMSINAKMKDTIKNIVGAAAMQGLNDMKSKYFQSHSNQRSYIYRTFDYSCEESNVFPQFLECIYHIMKQFPNDFEYNARLLCELQIGTYSCAYENFLFTSESERNNYNRAYIDRTGSPLPSIWDYINKNKSIFTNAKYVAPSPLSSNSNDTVGDTPPLYPDTTDIKHWQNDYMGCRKLMDLFKKI